ncbi:TetR/AcrR family transcriptional regulator [Marinigracilibium pacificum]|uniref:TetR/AcrR family transcriptional regulator n=1 Tax=Marinigracilibium pacificum TaxID=2729599 RepID=A0A848J1W2_9BACT|nr:TetR/AcrR family transcriptional regulator [Marinigracilibium pacificum]NMM50567.1 TetR/AcrR family transcriptional regulator [Marinigracilibium pacificum]
MQEEQKTEIQTQREKILEEAYALFMKYGIRSVTMDDLASSIGVSKKTIYSHFDDKNGLILEGTKYLLFQKQCEIDQYKHKADDVIIEMGLISKHIRESFQYMNPTMFYDMKKFYPESWALFQDFKENVFRKEVVRSIKEGIKQGYFREDIDLDVVSKIRMILFDSVLNMDEFSPQEYNMADLQIKVFDFFVRGLLSEKGLKRYEEIYKSFISEQNQQNSDS